MVAFNSRSNLLPALSPKTSQVAGPSPNQAAAQHDAGLVHRFREGDETAFAEIVSRHRPRVFGVALARLRNHADAEEIAQDTFVRAYRGLAQFRGESSLATWLHRIAVNLSLNRYWYFFRRGRHLAQSFDRPLTEGNSYTLADAIPSGAPGPLEEAMTGEFTRLVSGAMIRLEPAQREILHRRNGLNHRYSEIAAALGIKLGTVKSRIARARHSLRLQMAASCPEFSADSCPEAWFGALRSGAMAQAA